ncbi:carboxypeptidase-like regulatory domain-containing protein [Maribellus sp. CM-23]|uniref:DUF5686 and carboxypeptidase-like regulatory domain-containing protein n=1 Tax=Maribellus sp. CM-23 TaxID=2781026 RepID=UPI001F29E50F|nr:DUF5686 and carboxypeptidase-like regulatory domain-containing protein [Maribellus sp. CM-23]MCE4565802.1 carboxypeptidase-like regulatory domain-containing protein [Maribellus sp. CM-23]
MLRRIFTTATLLVVVSWLGTAQEVTGVVQDVDTKEAIPFANIWIKGTTKGTQSNGDGYFVLKKTQGDTLAVSSVGYVQQEFVLNGKNEQLKVELKKEVQKIEEVTIKSDIPFARVVFNLIQKHKKENREKLEQVRDYKQLENTTVYIAVDTTAKINRFFDNMEEVTMEMEGQSLRFSPIYLLEEAEQVSADSMSVVYSKKDGIFPRLNPAIESLLLDNVVVDLDFYKEQIRILDRGFISPIAGSAWMYYNIYFNDSVYEGDHTYYHMTYSPKNPLNPLFSGSFLVDSETFALKSIEAYISGKANLNFVNGFRGTVTYKTLPDGGYFYDAQNIGINLSIRLNKDSASYSSRRMDQIASGNWLINKTTQYSNADRLSTIKPGDWKNQPEFSVEHLGEETYFTVNKLKEQKVVKGIDKVGGMALTSFYNAGKLDVGPVFDIYTTNRIEGTRLTVPLRTSEQMFKRFSVGGFLGYGSTSKEFKYGGNLIYQPGTTDKFLLRFRYYNDYNLISQDKFLRFIKNNPNNKGNANFIASFTTREKNPFLKEEQYVEFRVDYNGEKDVHLEASPYILWNKSTPYVDFVRDGVSHPKYTNYGVLFDLRLAFRQHYDKFFFERVYYINPVPVINLSWDVGTTTIPGVNRNDLGYYSHLHGSISGRLLMGQLFINYMLNGGYLFGDAPYDLLDQPVGSMSLGFAKYRFNLLHHASFAHNAYTNLHAHLNGGGFILNKIPLIRSFKLREIVSIKAHYGNLTKGYKPIFDLPGFYDNSKNVPYAEIGFGVTNVFKVLRVEYVRHLGGTYRNARFTDKNGIFFRTEMSF